jgi:hypothetical protein
MSGVILSPGRPRACIFLDDDFHFLDGHLCGLCFGIEEPS